MLRVRPGLGCVPFLGFLAQFFSDPRPHRSVLQDQIFGFALLDLVLHLSCGLVWNLNVKRRAIYPFITIIIITTTATTTVRKQAEIGCGKDNKSNLGENLDPRQKV